MLKYNPSLNTHEFGQEIKQNGKQKLTKSYLPISIERKCACETLESHLWSLRVSISIYFIL